MHRVSTAPDLSSAPLDVSDLPVRHLTVFTADQFPVVHGVNEGDDLTDASEMVFEDTYMRAKGAVPTRLALAMDAAGTLAVGAATGVGTTGAPVFLDALATFMTPTRETLEALIFVEVEADTGHIAGIYLHPLDEVVPERPYMLVTIDREKARQRLAESASVSFTRGTRITMADGRQVPVEDLQPGDKVLTRDSGPQEVRWVGLQTMRAEGAFAPVTIAAGALNNERNLVVSPHHRLFIYQRVDAMGTGQRELLVKAGLLVNGTTVTQSPGGFIDYVQVLFDTHEIVYAEGIASESLFVDTTTKSALPAEIARRLTPEAPSSYPLGAVELSQKDLAKRRDAVEMLRRVSSL